MKRFVIALGALLIFAALPLALTSAADETKSLTGEPIDIACYMGKGAMGTGHAACASGCVGKGMPAGLLVKEGEKSQIYLIMGGGGKKVPELVGSLMGKQAKLTGKVTSKDGLMIIEATEAVEAK